MVLAGLTSGTEAERKLSRPSLVSQRGTKANVFFLLPLDRKPKAWEDRAARAWPGIRKSSIGNVGCRVLVVNMQLVLMSNSLVLGGWSIVIMLHG